MYLEISYQQKDAAKAAFKNAGIPLKWNAAQKKWETSVSIESIPEALRQYTHMRADAYKPSYHKPNMTSVEQHNRRIVAEESGMALCELDEEDARNKARMDAEAATFLENGGLAIIEEEMRQLGL